MSASATLGEHLLPLLEPYNVSLKAIDFSALIDYQITRLNKRLPLQLNYNQDRRNDSQKRKFESPLNNQKVFDRLSKSFYYVKIPTCSLRISFSPR